MAESREVRCLGCNRVLWSTTWPSPSRVTGGCCIPKYEGPMPQPIVIGWDADGNEIIGGHAQYGGGTVETDPDHVVALGLLSPWKRVSCPWQCDGVTFYRAATMMPLLCGRCGRPLIRECVTCKTRRSFVPDNYLCCGAVLGSVPLADEPIESLAARVAA